MIFMENGLHHGQQPNEAESTCCQLKSTTWIGSYTLRSKRIDVISRIIFPLVFAVFNMAYWSTYINANPEQ